jgi:hypothetical protein
MIGFLSGISPGSKRIIQIFGDHFSLDLMEQRVERGKSRIDRGFIVFCAGLWILIGITTLRSAYYAYQRHTVVGQTSPGSRLSGLMSPSHAFFAGDVALIFGIILLIVALRHGRNKAIPPTKV